MSRFFKSAAFPILIVVLLAFFAQRLISSSTRTSPPTYSQFIDQLKEKQPDLEARQRAGRALLWDKHVDREALGEFREGEIAQQPYVYQNTPR